MATEQEYGWHKQKQKEEFPCSCKILAIANFNVNTQHIQERPQMLHRTRAKAGHHVTIYLPIPKLRKMVKNWTKKGGILQKLLEE